MISFYPGPSRVEDCIPEYVSDAFNRGILSINHRSDEFMALTKATIEILKDRLNIPENFSVFFTSSATECWEIIAQSLIKKESFHIYNGAFGQKWFQHTQRITSTAQACTFDVNAGLEAPSIDIPSYADTLCITQNETSNGTQVSNARLAAIQKQYPETLIAIDATSSMAGIQLYFQNADVWYASVQKCFGLPAGLAVMICSPRAVNRAKELNDQSRYNSLLSIINMIEKHQTTHTPNVMGIYLLNRVMESRKPIHTIEEQTKNRYGVILSCLKNSGLKHLVDNTDVRSLTVIPVQGGESFISQIKKKAREQGIVLGNGYGSLNANTFRIANFPAIKDAEIDTLTSFLKNYT